MERIFGIAPRPRRSVARLPSWPLPPCRIAPSASPWAPAIQPSSQPPGRRREGGGWANRPVRAAAKRARHGSALQTDIAILEGARGPSRPAHGPRSLHTRDPMADPPLHPPIHDARLAVRVARHVEFIPREADYSAAKTSCYPSSGRLPTRRAQSAPRADHGHPRPRNNLD